MSYAQTWEPGLRYRNSKTGGIAPTFVNHLGLYSITEYYGLLDFVM
jgi:hypothetical protein